MPLIRKLPRKGYLEKIITPTIADIIPRKKIIINVLLKVLFQFIYLHKYMKRGRLYLSLFLISRCEMKQDLYKAEIKPKANQNKIMRKREQNKIVKGQKYKETIFNQFNYQNNRYICSALFDTRNRQDRLDNTNSTTGSKSDNSNNIKPYYRLFYGFKKYLQTKYRNKKGLACKFFIDSVTLTNQKEDYGLPPTFENVGIRPTIL